MFTTLKERLTGGRESGGINALAALSLDDVHHILSVSRRRHIISYVAQTDDAATLAELATYVASEEYDCSPDDVRSQEYKRVYVALKQNHLPKLDSHDIVDFARNDVYATPRTQALDEIRRDTRSLLGGDGQ